MTSFLPLPRSREGFLLPPFPSFNDDPEKRLKEIQDLDTRETDILVNSYPKSGKRALYYYLDLKNYTFFLVLCFVVVVVVCFFSSNF